MTRNLLIAAAVAPLLINGILVDDGDYLYEDSLPSSNYAASSAVAASPARELGKKYAPPTMWEPMTYTDPLPPTEDQLRRSTPIQLPPTYKDLRSYGAASGGDCLYALGAGDWGTAYRLLSSHESRLSRHDNANKHEREFGSSVSQQTFEEPGEAFQLLGEKECLNALGVSSWASARRLLERRAREIPNNSEQTEMANLNAQALPPLIMCVQDGDPPVELLTELETGEPSRELGKKKGYATNWEPMTYTDPLPPTEDQLRRSTPITLPPTVLCMRDFARIANSGYAVPPGTQYLGRGLAEKKKTPSNLITRTEEDDAYAAAGLAALDATMVSIDGLVRQLRCPRNSTLLNGECVFDEFVAPTFLCPPHASLHISGEYTTEMCRVEHQAFVDCADGYDMLDGVTCIKKDLRPAEVNCPDLKMKLDQEALSCIEFIEGSKTCPVGFSLETIAGEERCVREILAEQVCEDTEFIVDPENPYVCMKPIRTAAAVICPAGATLSANKSHCLTLQQDPPRCPPGFNFHAKLETCVRRSGAVRTRCPDGYSEKSGACERTVESPPTLKCPDNYTLDATAKDSNGAPQCAGEIPVPPRCREGLRPSDLYEGACEKVVTETRICPEGTKAIGEGSALRCQIVRKHAPILSCSPGLSLDGEGRCRRLEETVPTYTCNGEDCYRERVYALRYACPTGTEFFEERGVGPRCVRGISADVCLQSRTPEKVWMSTCMQATRQGREIESSTAQSLREATRSAAAAAFEECRRQRDALPKCEDYGLSRNLFNAQPFCPDGGKVQFREVTIDGETRQEKMCVTQEPSPTDPHCPMGRLENGKCIREVVVPAKQECPPGTFRDGDDCLSMEHREPRLVCPAGSYGGPDGLCYAYEAMDFFAPQKFVAPPDFACYSRQATLRDGRCVESDVRSMEVLCADDFIPFEGDCMETTYLIIPKAVEKLVVPSYVCPKGQEIVGAECYSKVTSPTITKCPLGALVKDRKCLKHVTPFVPQPATVHHRPNVVCPADTISRGAHCLHTLKESPKKTCPGGMSLSGDLCSRVFEKLPVCPAGMRLRDRKCVRHIKVPASMEVIEGCVTDIVKPCPDCPKTVRTVCHSPRAAAVQL